MSESPKRFLVDQDNVVADFDRGVLMEWRARYPDRRFIPLDQRRTFYVRDDYPPQYRADLEAIYTAPGFIVNLPPIPGAIEALLDMKSRGHVIRICSSPLSQYQHCVEEKYAWVENQLGREWVNSMILLKDKTEIIGDILIDDRPDLSGDLEPTWEHVLFDQPYNQHITNKRRFINWQDWQAILLH